MQTENNKIKEIDLEILPKEVRIELVDFYEYLITKYKKHKKVEKRERLQKILSNPKGILSKGYKFDREEAHER